MTKVIILDDEQSAINILEKYLGYYDNLEVVGSFKSLAKAEEAILRIKPDLLFLDIRINGDFVFPMIERLKKRHLDFAIIFVTGFYDKHLNDIIESCQFRYHFSYLGKPVDRALLTERLADFHVFVDDNNVSSFDKDYLVVKVGSNYKKVPFTDIFYCESDGNYANIFFQHEGELRRRSITSSLGDLDEKLPSEDFFRISAKHLIRRERFDSVDVDGSTRNCVLRHPDVDKLECLVIPEKKWKDFKEGMF